MNFKKILKIFFSSALAAVIYNKAVAIMANACNILNKETGHDFLWDYGTVWYEKKGSGTPVVLLHELTSCSSGYEWSRLSEKLSEDHTVYIPDLPGCGRSDKPGISYSNFLYVKFLMHFLEETVCEPATIITSGSSSSFALLSTAFPQSLVKKIICINPSAPEGKTQALSLYGRCIKLLLELPIAGTLFYNHCVSIQKIKERFEKEYFCSSDSSLTEAVAAYHESAHKSLCFARKMYAAEIFNYCIMPVKHLISKDFVSVDIIFGANEEDAEYLKNAYLNLNDKIQASMIPNTAHLPQLEAPEALYADLLID